MAAAFTGLKQSQPSVKLLIFNFDLINDYVRLSSFKELSNYPWGVSLRNASFY